MLAVEGSRARDLESRSAAAEVLKLFCKSTAINYCVCAILLEGGECTGGGSRAAPGYSGGGGRAADAGRPGGPSQQQHFNVGMAQFQFTFIRQM